MVFLSARGQEVNQRIILDVIDAPRAGGEMKHAMKAFDRMLPLLPGATTTIYDGAMRGVHRRRIFALGKIPLSPPRNPKTNSKPKERHLGLVDVIGSSLQVDPGKPHQLALHLIDAAPHVIDTAVNGSPIHVRMERIKTTKPTGPRGRTYGEYVVPDDFGGGIIRLPVVSDRDDMANDFNREEWLHPIAPGDPDYDRLMPSRNDAESGNANLDRYLDQGRAHSIGRAGILVNCITWAVYKNAQAVALQARSQAPPAMAA
jgi:hypothetical protein